MNKRLITLCAAGGMTFAAIAWAGPGQGGEQGGPRGERGHGRGIEHLVANPELAKEFGVTDEQIAAVKAASYEQRKKAIELRSAVELAGLEVKHLMQAEPVDRAAVMAAVDVAAKAKTDLRKSQISYLLDVKEIMGAETMQKIRAQARERFSERREEFRGERRGGPGGPDGGRGPEGERGPGFGQGGGPQGGAPWMQDEMTPPDEMEDDDVSAI